MNNLHSKADFCEIFRIAGLQKNDNNVILTLQDFPVVSAKNSIATGQVNFIQPL